MSSAFAGLRVFLRLLLSTNLNRIGALLVAGTVVVAALAPLIATHDPYAQPSRRFEPPSAEHWMGTDDLGRDVFSRTVYGTRISMLVALGAVLISGAIGTTAGAVAGYYKGRLGEVIMRISDVWLAFPGIVLAIFLSAILGPSLGNATIAIGIVFAPLFARVARAQVLAVVERDFVAAAQALGGRSLRILLRHVMPNAAAPIVVQATVSFAAAVVAEASLSFLGLGAQPPEPSWGTMVSTGRRFMEFAPWVVLFPGFAIALAVLGLNLLGDAIRDVLDPRTRLGLGRRRAKVAVPEPAKGANPPA